MIIPWPLSPRDGSEVGGDNPARRLTSYIAFDRADWAALRSSTPLVLAGR
jgi:hypothetical protein